MRCRVNVMVLVLASVLIMGLGTVTAQPMPDTNLRQSSVSLHDEVLSPEVTSSRRAAIQAQLDTLDRSTLTQEEKEKARLPLDEMLQLFNQLEEARERYTEFRQQLADLPKRLKELTAAQTKLDAHPPNQFQSVSETLRDQYDSRLHAVQTEIQELLKQNSAGEARLAALPQELEHRLTERPRLQQRLAEARRRPESVEPGNQQGTDVARLEVKLQVLLSEVRALEVERQWLSQRGSLHDALLRAAQTRLTHLQEDLSTITQALGKTFEEEQATLAAQVAELEQALQTVTDAVESLRLTVELETLRLRQATADYRQQLNRLNTDVLAQEQLTVHARQDSDRMTALFEKYTAGESGGELVVLAFERLQRDRQRFRGMSSKGIKARLRTVTEWLYKTEDQLYSYDREIETRLELLRQSSQATLPVELRQAFDDQQSALREQQQVLMAITHEYTTLLALHREHRQLLDDSYYNALTQMFWLRDAERINLTTIRQILVGAGEAVVRLREMIGTEQAVLSRVFTGGIHLWLLVLILFTVGPWMTYKIYRYLREVATSLFTQCAERELPCGVIEALLIVVRAAVWPSYLVVLAWARMQLMPEDAILAEWPITSCLYVSAVILFVILLARDILRGRGWGRQFWGWDPEMCRFLYRMVWLGCLAAFILMVPRQFLLTAHGPGGVSVASLALARSLFLLFQSVILVLVAVVGWRQSPLMDGLLTRSQQEEGLLWRLWPFVYLVIIVGLIGVITLDVLGYRYAARFVWLRTLESFSVVVLWRLLLTLLLVRLLHRIVGYLVRLWVRGQQKKQSAETPFDQVFHVAYLIGNTLLAIVAAGTILEIWGVSVSWLLTSPLGTEIIRRTIVIAITIGLMILVMQVSKAVSEYLVQPRTGPHGIVNQPNRKFRTMVPLTHTLIKFGIVFGAILIILQQLNVAIGPILTGVGIFGLAVGFASQSLIKDVINGLFILFEDSLSVGDIVTLRGISGEVEKVTLRAVTVRDLEGNVHVIPNSTLDLITNMTKVFSRHVIDVGVAYRENVDEVVDILREVSEELINDPEFGWDMRQPLEIMGVQDFSDSAVVIRTRLWTQPGKQWRLGREFRRRLKQRFDERGIEIPFPHRTIYWGTPKESPQPPIQISLDPPPPSQRADNGVPRSSERKEPPIIEG